MVRKYEMRSRATRQEETRQRIVEATVLLHERVGPARTTISAIAEQAGVDRSTVYRYFPDERSLLEACTSHFNAANPPPEPAAWTEIADPERRLEVALAEIFDYYRRTEGMMEKATRDLPELPLMQEVLESDSAHWVTILETLTSGWNVDEEARPLLVAAIGHAIDFPTWRSLVRQQGLDDRQAVVLMVCMVNCSRAAAQM
jgi:AcrR family transcriptional regulator